MSKYTCAYIYTHASMHTYVYLSVQEKGKKNKTEDTKYKVRILNKRTMKENIPKKIISSVS